LNRDGCRTDLSTELEKVATEFRTNGKDVKRYVQLSANRPFTVVMVQEVPLLLLKRVVKLEPTVRLAKDATGGVVNQIAGLKGETFYYAAVVNVPRIRLSVANAEALMKKTESLF